MKIHIENIFFETDGRNSYDQTINDSIKQYDEVTKISTEQSDDFTTGCLLDFAYFEKQLQINCGWFKQKKTALDADSRAIQQIIFTGKTAIQQIIFTGKTDNTIGVSSVLEQSKETIPEFARGTTKVLQLI